MIDLSIVIVSWNTRELLSRSLAATLRGAEACAPRIASELTSSVLRSPALTRIEYHRSPNRFFLRHRGAGRAAVVWMLRLAKSLVRVVPGAPLAVASRRLRPRWRVQREVLAWQLRGCPAGVGLAPLGAERAP